MNFTFRIASLADDQPDGFLRGNLSQYWPQILLNSGLTLLPVFGTAAACLWVWRMGLSRSAIVTFLFFYVVTGVGITLGFHRLVTHRSYSCPSWFRYGMALAGSLAFQGPVIRWVADHRRHHRFSDTPKDPHSPVSGRGRNRVSRFMHGYVLWIYSPESTSYRRYAPDLLRDAGMIRLEQYYFLLCILSVVAPATMGLLIGGGLGGVDGMLVGGFVRIWALQQITWSVNAFGHTVGSRDSPTNDGSRNNWWMAIPTIGDGWHNNHHAHPSSARHGLGRWQLDLGYLTLLLLEKVGLVWSISLPKEAKSADDDAIPA